MKYSISKKLKDGDREAESFYHFHGKVSELLTKSQGLDLAFAVTFELPDDNEKLFMLDNIDTDYKNLIDQINNERNELLLTFNQSKLSPAKSCWPSEAEKKKEVLSRMALAFSALPVSLVMTLALENNLFSVLVTSAYIGFTTAKLCLTLRKSLKDDYNKSIHENYVTALEGLCKSFNNFLLPHAQERSKQLEEAQRTLKTELASKAQALAT